MRGTQALTWQTPWSDRSLSLGRPRRLQGFIGGEFEKNFRDLWRVLLEDSYSWRNSTIGERSHLEELEKRSCLEYPGTRNILFPQARPENILIHGVSVDYSDEIYLSGVEKLISLYELWSQLTNTKSKTWKDQIIFMWLNFCPRTKLKNGYYLY